MIRRSILTSLDSIVLPHDICPMLCKSVCTLAAATAVASRQEGIEMLNKISLHFPSDKEFIDCSFYKRNVCGIEPVISYILLVD